MTGDDWVNQMHDYMEVHHNESVVAGLFMIMFCFENFICLSLFIAVILENFQIAEAKKMQLQVEQSKKKKTKAEKKKKQPRVTFVHRLTWLLGGVGKETGTLWAMKSNPVSNERDPETGLFPDGTEMDENGLILPGSKWYNNDKALFVLGHENSVRKKAFAITNHKYFDILIVAAILTSTVLLAYEGPKGSLDSETEWFCERINDALFVLFVMELTVKAVAYGFVFTPEAYFKSHWNKMDFVVILGSMISYLGVDAGLIRLLRCLRPLRIINRNEGMRVIISAVIDSVGVNLGVLALSTLGLLIFAILGVSILGGKMYSCNCVFVYPRGVTPQSATFDRDGGWSNRTDPTIWSSPGNSAWMDRNRNNLLDFDSGNDIKQVITQQDCLGIPVSWAPADYEAAPPSTQIYGVDPTFPDAISACYWENRPYNFDSVRNAMMSLFTCSTLAGWTDVMEIGMDSMGTGYQPINFSTTGNAFGVALYFVGKY